MGDSTAITIPNHRDYVCIHLYSPRFSMRIVISRATFFYVSVDDILMPVVIEKDDEYVRMRKALKAAYNKIVNI